MSLKIDFLKKGTFFVHFTSQIVSKITVRNVFYLLEQITCSELMETFRRRSVGVSMTVFLSGRRASGGVLTE